MTHRLLPLLTLAALACAPKRQPQSLSDFSGGITLDVPIPAEEDAMGAAFFEALLPPGTPNELVTATPDAGIQLTCEIKARRLTISVIAMSNEVDDSRYSRTECVLGGITIPVVILW